MTTPRDTLVEPIAAELALRTDPGRDPEKQINEDAGFHKATRFGTLCVVCDGMGGHANGQDASAAATRAIQETFDGAPAGASGRELLRDGITLGHQRIRELPLAAGEARAGSTVVAVLLTPHGAEVAHVGDSRVLFMSRGRIQQITRDHSMVQLMVEAGMIRPEEAATHPDANKIMRALGIAAEVQVELRPEPVPFAPGDVFVLASDGLTDLVTEAEILAMAGQVPLEQAAGQLVDLANARGGHDNITVLLARPREGSSSSSAAATLVSAGLGTVPDPPAARAGATVLAAPLASPAPTGSPAVATVPIAPALGVVPGAGPPPHVGPAVPAVLPPSPPRSQRSAAAPTRPWWLIGILVLAAVVAVAVASAGLYAVIIKPEHVDPQIAVPLSALPRVGEPPASSESEPTAAPSLPAETPPLAPPSAPGHRGPSPSARPPGE
ncbi:MAG: protein phosphatase 2C domain-containing protein [Myxococcales bacterium]|nr:protein phosphatase 2C domain-containing protein [Myxococcales bacterium]MBL0192894.1 protein phosphatase 2C domain-containing protein [Myxococcales bacterium]